MSYNTANANATTSIFNYIANNPSIGVTLSRVTNNSFQTLTSLPVNNIGIFNDAAFNPTITVTLLKHDPLTVAAASGSGGSSEVTEVWIG